MIVYCRAIIGPGVCYMEELVRELKRHAAGSRFLHAERDFPTAKQKARAVDPGEPRVASRLPAGPLPQQPRFAAIEEAESARPRAATGDDQAGHAVGS